jgi:MFS family permease
MYAGLIGASFSVAQFFTTFAWSWLSDRIGRRPVIMIGLFGNIITSLWFGLSKSFISALIARFSCGLLNGNIAVAKCVLGEVTDRTNQAKGTF